MSIGERIKEERERLGLSQEAFAKLGGVSKRSQIMYEQDKTEAGAGYFTLTAQAGADVTYILTGIRAQPLLQDQPPPSPPQIREAPAPYAADPLMMQKERIKQLVDQAEDARKLGAVQDALEDEQRLKRMERELAELRLQKTG